MVVLVTLNQHCAGDSQQQDNVETEGRKRKQGGRKGKKERRKKEGKEGRGGREGGNTGKEKDKIIFIQR